jgi:hypothetical protein
MKTAIIALLTVIVLILAYRFLFNPQMLLVSGDPTVCPERWTYLDGLCIPSYETSCAAFRPDVITSKAQSCNIARSCGTNWPGKCP